MPSKGKAPFAFVFKAFIYFNIFVSDTLIIMVMHITDIQLFQILKERLGEKEAEALVSFVDSKLKENNENNSKILATKEDIAKLDTKISDVKSDIIRWVFGIFIVLMLAIIGLYFKK